MRTSRSSGARTLVAGLVASAFLASCSGTVGERPAGTTEAFPADGGAGSTTPAPVAPPTLAPTETEALETAGPVEEGDRTDPGDQELDSAPTGSTDPVQAEGQGQGSLLFVAVRVAAREGFDRVVFEYEGDGIIPGYKFSYKADAIGPSGDPIDVPGDTGLSGDVEGIDWTADGNYTGPGRLSAEGTVSVTEVLAGTLFEGYHEPYIGVTEEKPFRVTVLEEPTRIVVDIAH